MPQPTPADPDSPGPGRPRILADVQKRDHICTLISVGAGIDAAARHVGCSTFTVRREAQRDPEFARLLREAETAAELVPLRALRQAANTHWRAAAWMLERSHPEQFGRRSANSFSPKHLKLLIDELAALFAEECTEPKLRMRLHRRLLEIEEANQAAASTHHWAN